LLVLPLSWFCLAFALPFLPVGTAGLGHDHDHDHDARRR
jgi:hypothetical protein